MGQGKRGREGEREEGKERDREGGTERGGEGSRKGLLEAGESVCWGIWRSSHHSVWSKHLVQEEERTDVSRDEEQERELHLCRITWGI